MAIMTPMETTKWCVPLRQCYSHLLAHKRVCNYISGMKPKRIKLDCFGKTFIYVCKSVLFVHEYVYVASLFIECVIIQD